MIPVSLLQVILFKSCAYFSLTTHYFSDVALQLYKSLESKIEKLQEEMRLLSSSKNNKSSFSSSSAINRSKTASNSSRKLSTTKPNSGSNSSTNSKNERSARLANRKRKLEEEEEEEEENTTATSKKDESKAAESAADKSSRSASIESWLANKKSKTTDPEKQLPSRKKNPAEHLSLIHISQGIVR